MKVFVETYGYAQVAGVLPAKACAALVKHLGPVTTAGRRGLLDDEKVYALANSPAFLDLLELHLPARPRPVRAIYFNKSDKANWAVAWHQDLTIAVKEQRDVAGFGPWSVKESVPHVQAPPELLGKMLTLRLHLDNADETNGALLVLPGSHRYGLLDTEAIARLRSEKSAMLCHAKVGDVLLMRPLLLHASGKTDGKKQRRVLHIEYAAFDLPGGLEWSEGRKVKPTKAQHYMI